MTPARRPATLAVALTLVILSACGGSTPAGTGSSPGTASAAPAASQAGPGSSVGPATSPASGESGTCGADVATALRAAAAAQDAASSFRIEGTVDAGGTTTPYTLEIQRPDRVHAIFGPLEVIGIGPTAWREVAGSWIEQPNMDVQSLVAGKGQLDAEIADKGTFTNVSVDPGASVDGSPAILYGYHESIPSELEADVQLWLDPATCRPMKNVASSTASSTESSIDVTYSGWGEVTIEKPA